MPRVRTHYDNLRVARNAPPEIIRAAYKALSQKYHPDRNPGDQKAARIMMIINRAYEVLSDPMKRRQHDVWITRAELDAESQAYDPEVESESTPQPAVSVSRQSGRDSTQWLRFQSTPGDSQLVATIIIVIAIGFWRAMSSDSINTHQSTPPTISVIANSPKMAQAPVQPARSYVRQAVAPNGRPWPINTGYASGYKLLHTGGLSTLTVDNTRNDSDVFVKLVTLETKEPAPVGHFFIKAGEQFKMSGIRAGRYDVRYRNLDSGVLSKTESFQLTQTEVEGGTRYDTIKLTLYKIPGGNMNMQEITEEEFGDVKPNLRE